MTHTITHALLSVSDKTGIVEFAAGLHQRNIALLSTGGTATLLKENHIPVTDIAEFTGFPEMMAGRLKTLHPKIYAGILARSGIDESVLEQHHFERIGLVVVNLYPFEQTIEQDNCTLAQAIENIDIGGPTLLRAAAKNFDATTVIVDQQDYATVLQEIDEKQMTTLETRFALAKKVFAHVAKYDAAISNYFSSLPSLSQSPEMFPSTLTLQFQKNMALRYGENPHQKAAFYQNNDNGEIASLSNAVQHLGKPLSYNNINDADAALECVSQFDQPACVIVKHANPCACAIGEDSLSAYQTAYSMDPVSAFGGILAFNKKLEADTLSRIISNQFAEVIIAPAITQEALDIAQQKPNLRILTVHPIDHKPQPTLDIKSVMGGMLLQERDNLPSPPSLEVVTKRQPSEQELGDLLFAWQIVRFVKSNAIVYVKDKTTIGIGAGQMSRVFSTKIAEEKAQQAGVSIQGAVMASDAFFPFRDSIDQAASVGITAIIQPGGSIRDAEVIAAANEHNIAMIFTHIRHFRH
jgi:phosphoribosylaminoimidazolecarboxamide formyltransferase/IMP cyclohydrolase